MKKLVTLISTLSILIILSGCSSTSRYSTASVVCQKWQKEGLVMATLRACTACVDQLGAGNPQAIQGCALGMDASQFLTSGN